MVETSTSGRKAIVSSKRLGYTDIFGCNFIANASTIEERPFEYYKKVLPNKCISREVKQDITNNVFNPKLSANPKSLREGAFQQILEHELSEGSTFQLWNSGLP